MENNGNIILHQLLADGSSFKIKEMLPLHIYSDSPQTLIKKGETFSWIGIDLSLNLIINDHFKDTSIYYDKGRIGIGRFPLFTYRVDLAVPKNSKVTAFHIGDGSFGFSMGNGTTQGFIPEIIGIGSDKNDAGLYFVGIAGDDKKSDVPLIILDSRSTYNTKLTNRPILGVTSGNYNEYSIVVDVSNNLIVKGNVSAPDIILNNYSLLEIIADLQIQIDDLKDLIP